MKNRIRALIRQDRAAIAVMAAVFMTGLVGMVGLGVDLGELYAAKAQLQNAVDSAAMAGAASMIGDFDGDGLAEADYDGAQTAAQGYLAQNEFLNTALSWSDSDAFTAGRWDSATATFSSTGPSSDANDLTAVQVTATRSAPTHFMKIAGINSLDITAQATAFVGWAKDVPSGQVDLPIAILDTAIPDCSTVLQFNSENTETAGWTSFFDYPANNNNIEDYIDGSKEVPALSVGDDIALNNGVIASLFSALQARFEAMKDENGIWRVVLPVFEEGSNSTVGKVVGFVNFDIYEVLGPPDKTLGGQMECISTVSSGSTTGGADFGVRAGRPVLIN